MIKKFTKGYDSIIIDTVSLKNKNNYFMSESVTSSLSANISRSTDPFSIILGSLESPWSGLYGQKKSSPIGSLDSEIFTFKVEVRTF